jgi:aryl-alcohol dehydrogenase-like predicted oxidoreductase
MTLGSSKWEKWVLDEEASLPIFKAAYDAGINTWDIGDVYLNGASEVAVRRAIKKYQIPRDKLVILTKCFGVVDELDLSNRVLAPRANEWINGHGPIEEIHHGCGGC